MSKFKVTVFVVSMFSSFLCNAGELRVLIDKETMLNLVMAKIERATKIFENPHQQTKSQDLVGQNFLCGQCEKSLAADKNCAFCCLLRQARKMERAAEKMSQKLLSEKKER